jgi:hypothetical protein
VGDSDHAFNRRFERVAPRKAGPTARVVDCLAQLESNGARQDRQGGGHQYDPQPASQLEDVGLSLEGTPVDPEKGGDGESDEGLFDVHAFDQVQDRYREEEGLAHDPGPSLSPPDAARQDDQSEPAEGGQRRRGLGDVEREQLAQNVEPIPQRVRHGRHEGYEAEREHHRACDAPNPSVAPLA